MFPINSRTKDVVIALGIATRYNQELGRLRLQKFIYLADIISVYWGHLVNTLGHKTYRNGPYDSDIQNAVDVLAFRGFVKIMNSNIKEDGSVTAAYISSEAGLVVFENIRKEAFLHNRVDLFESVARHVNRIGWKHLKALVYVEPTYLFNKTNGWGYRLDYSSLLTNDTLRILDGFRKMFDNKTLSKENFTTIYFKLLEANLKNANV